MNDLQAKLLIDSSDSQYVCLFELYNIREPILMIPKETWDKLVKTIEEQTEEKEKKE
jgi:hypothetical protein